MGYEFNDKYKTLFAGYWAPDDLQLLFKKLSYGGTLKSAMALKMPRAATMIKQSDRR